MALRSNKAFWSFALPALITCVVGMTLARAIDDSDFGIARKLAFFRKHAAQTNTLFLGSSRIVNGLDPVTFDAVTAYHGVETRSFNLGSYATHLVETEYMLRKALTMPNVHLDYVVVEVLPSIYPWELEWKDEGCPAGYTVGLGQLAHLAVRGARQGNRLEARASVACFYQNLFSFGFLWRALGPMAEKNQESLGLERLGFAPRDRIINQRTFDQAWDRLEEQVASRNDEPLPSEYVDIYREMKRLANAHGASLALVRMPQVSFDIPHALKLPKDEFEIIADGCDLASPLYQRRYFADQVHLNREGANRLTDLFAKAFVAWHRRRQNEKSPVGEAPSRALSSFLGTD